MFISVSCCEVQHRTQYSRCLSRAERKDHLPQLADDALPNVFRKAIGLLCQEGPFLSHGQLGPQLPFCQVACQPPARTGAWSFSSLGAGPAIAFTEFHNVLDKTFLYLPEITSNDSAALGCTLPPQILSPVNLLKLCPVIPVLMKLLYSVGT